MLLIDPVGYAAFVERVTAFIEHEHGFSRKPRAEVVPADVSGDRWCREDPLDYTLGSVE